MAEWRHVESLTDIGRIVDEGTDESFFAGMLAPISLMSDSPGGP